MLYLIKLINQKVSLLEYDPLNNTFVQIHKNGEAWQAFEEKTFWQWGTVINSVSAPLDL